MTLSAKRSRSLVSHSRLTRTGPAHFAECGLVESITAGVPIQLVPPEFLTLGRLRDPIPRTAFVPMPEATVNEDHLTSRAEYEVGTAGEVARVKTVAIPQAVYEPPNPHLGFRVLGPDSAHSFAAFTNRERVETALPHVETKSQVANHGDEERSGWLSAGVRRAGILTPWPQINDTHDHLPAMA